MLSRSVPEPLIASPPAPPAPGDVDPLTATFAESLATTLPVLGSVVGIGLVALGTLLATALIGYSPTMLDQVLEDGERPDRAARTQEIAARDAEYLVVATIFGAAGWVLGLWSLLGSGGNGGATWALASFFAAMLFVGGCLPMAVAQARPERTLLALLPVVRAGWFALRWPVVLPLLATTRPVLALLRLRGSSRPDPADVQKQVIAAVADSVTEEALAHDERQWIGNIVGLKDLQVSTLMTPRADIVGLPEAMPAREAVQKALEHGFSRYPVYRDRIDVVVGIFYVKDALRLLHADVATAATTTVGAMMREPLFVPETMGAAQLLRRFQAGNQHMAVVLDEYGTTSGLATVEDLIEAIVGDISDEYDNPPIAPPQEEQIEVVEQGRVLEIPGRTTVAEVNQQLGSELPEEGDWETVAGMVITKCNHIPIVGETVVVDGVEFRVLAADERRIKRLRVTALSPEPAEDSQ